MLLVIYKLRGGTPELESIITSSEKEDQVTVKAKDTNTEFGVVPPYEEEEGSARNDLKEEKWQIEVE
jgi:hypothetical protein